MARFFKSEGPKITVAKVVFLIAGLTNITGIIYLIDSFGYFDVAKRFAYGILSSSFHDLFTVISIIIVSFHFSRAMLKAFPSKIWLYLTYSAAILLIIGQIVAFIINGYYQLIFDTIAINVKQMNAFRLSVFCVLIVYFSVCTSVFVYRLTQVWNVRSDKKRSRYQRLVTSIILILFNTIVLFIIKVIFFEKFIQNFFFFTLFFKKVSISS